MYYHNIHGWFDYELFYQQWLHKSLPNAIFVEVGVWLGKSLCYMAELAHMTGRTDVSINGVDLWLGSSGEPLHDQFIKALNNCPRSLEQICKSNLKEAGVLDRVKLFKEDSVGAAANFESSSLDLVFLDANHSYMSVIRDIRAWKPKIKSGGMIAGHDIVSWPSVREAVRDSFGHYERTGDVWMVSV